MVQLERPGSRWAGSEEAHEPLRWQLPVLLIALIGLLIGGASFALSQRWQDHTAQQSFLLAAREHGESLLVPLARILDSVHALRAYALYSQFIEESEFADFTAPLLARHPGLEALALVARVPAADRARFEGRMQREKMAHAEIWQRDADDGAPRPALHRGEHLPVYRLETSDGDGSSLGMDLAAVPDLARAFAEARNHEGIYLTSPLEFPLGARTGWGVLAIIPIPWDDDTSRTVEEKDARPETWGVALVSIDQMIQSVPSAATLRSHMLERFVSGRQRLLFSDLPDARGPEDLPPGLRHTTTLQLGDEALEVVVTSDPEPWKRNTAWIPWSILGAVLMLTAILAAYIRLLIDQRSEVERLVARRTWQLGESHQSLQAESLQRRQAEAQLREREHRMAAILDNAIDGIVTFDQEGAIDSFNSSANRMFGYDSEEMLGLPVERLFDASEAGALDFDSCSTTAPDFTGRRKDGSTFFAEVVSSQTILGGQPLSILCIRDATDRRQTERQLAHAQRMETIGQLTRGVAHDFNNLLAVILGNLQLLERRCGNDPRLLKPVASALRASTRGAELTQRLLAFSQRQALNIGPVDVNRLVEGSVDLLARTLGSAIHIETHLAPDVSPAKTDPAQLENCLITLAVNARDAMPDGGRLILETSNVRIEHADRHHDLAPGTYVHVAVSDTGNGMPRDVLAKAFDPFFTTKEPGKGTGLGLSMVHGFVKQTQGHVKIYSEPGHGAIIRLYLPTAEGSDVAPPPAVASTRESPARTETVLLVEDDADVREVATTLLEEFGYRVLVANDAPSALAIFESNAEIDLLCTDIVMPGGMSGRELGTELLRRRPSLPVVYCSGYNEYAVFREGRLGSRERFLVKPYTREALDRTIRDALESEVKE